MRRVYGLHRLPYGSAAQPLPARTFDVLYNIELNEYNGRKSLQLNIKDIKPAGTPD